MKRVEINLQDSRPPTKAEAANASHTEVDLPVKGVKRSQAKTEDENASLLFVGTATTLLEWEGIRIMTDPNFLHAGDHVHLGHGVTATRRTNPAVNLEELPRIDLILLSHYHEDHFDKKVEESLRRDIPIISTPHAKEHLTAKGEDGSFTRVYDLDFFDSAMVHFNGVDSAKNSKPAVKVTGMPGKHVPSGILNDILKVIPPTNGWMVELGYVDSSGEDESFKNGYRIYISGDTLMVDELKQIPERYKGQNIDLALFHLGGTTIPGPRVPVLMVTMDGKQGLELLKLIKPDVTIPIHYDDYDVFLSPLSEFQKLIAEEGLEDKVVYLDRGEQYKFTVRTAA